MTKNIISALISILLMPIVGFGRGIDLTNLKFENLEDAIANVLGDKNDGYIYERNSILHVQQVDPKSGEVVVCVNGVCAIIISSRDYVDNDLIVGKYFKAMGRGSFTSSQLRAPHVVKRYKELSYKEAEQVEEAKRQQKELMARLIYEDERERAIERALWEIKFLTEDIKVIDDAYRKATSIYDEHYQEPNPKFNAECAVQKFANELIGGIKRENERKFLEWAKSHPDEYAAMLKAQEKERQRRAKAKLDAELAENDKRMSEFRKFAESFRMSNDNGIAPKSRRELQRFIGMRLVPKFDPWDCEYRYKSNGGAFSITSSGPDKTPNTTDDIIVTVAELPEAERPVNRRLSKLRHEVVEKRRAVNEYKGGFVPSVCGYTFGSKPINICDAESMVTLAKPFRKCKEAVLKYDGYYDPRLVCVYLLARLDSGESASAQTEGAAIARMLERNYGIKMQTVCNGASFITSYSGDGIEIEIRNDMLMQDDSGHVILTVAFKDTRLISLIEDLDASVLNLEEQENALKQQPGSVVPEKLNEAVDDDGFDVLSGSTDVQNAKRDAANVNDAGTLNGMTKKQIEEIKEFRKRMQKLREEMERNKHGDAKSTKSAPGKKSGVIETRSEGPVISTM